MRSLGLTRSAPARRAGLKQPAVACLEMGGTMPGIQRSSGSPMRWACGSTYGFEPLRTAS